VEFRELSISPSLGMIIVAMLSISADDIIRLSDRLYDSVHDSARLSEAMLALEEQTGAVKAMLAVFEQRLTGGEAYFADCDEEYSAGASLPNNPFMPALTSAAAGTIFTHDALLDGRFEHSQFFSEWARPQRFRSMSAMVTMREGRLFGFLGLSWDRANAQDEADAVLTALAPTLDRVTRLHLGGGVIRLAESQDTFDRMGVGAIVVDAAGRAAHVNAKADAILSDPYGGLSLAGGTLRAANRSQQRLLAGLIVAATRDGDTGMQPGGDAVLYADAAQTRPVLAVSVSPIRSAVAYGLSIGRAAMVLLRPLGARLPTGFASRLQSLFGLSPAEAALGISLVEGQSPADVAAARAVSIHTVRTQLAQLFRKTGTTRQSQLVAVLLRVMPLCEWRR
jgi:DNA-binding CsgD family transcriptional regulator